MQDLQTLLRQMADNWMLLAMLLFYVGAIVWVLRPGARKPHDEAANIPLRNDKTEETESR